MKHLRATLIVALGLTDAAIAITAACVALAWISLTDAEPQAELEPEEPEPGPWSWAELRSQPVARATLDAVDVMALREASDSAAVLALLARPL